MRKRFRFALGAVVTVVDDKRLRRRIVARRYMYEPPKNDVYCVNEALDVLMIDGYVWCDQTGSVHNDSLDPHGYGGNTCDPENHSPIFRRVSPLTE